MRRIAHTNATEFVVRAINLAPTQWLHENERATTMEKLLSQYLRIGDVPL